MKVSWKNKQKNVIASVARQSRSYSIGYAKPLCISYEIATSPLTLPYAAPRNDMAF